MARLTLSAPAPPYSSRDGKAQQAQLTHLADGLPGELPFLVRLLSDGHDFLFGEVAHHLTDHLLLFIEFEVHLIDSSLWSDGQLVR